MKLKLLLPCGILLLLGFYLFNQSPGITGAASFSADATVPLGFIIILAVLFAFAALGGLESRIHDAVVRQIAEGKWKPYGINPTSELEDIEQGYLSRVKGNRSSIQARIEHAVHGGPIEPQNQRATYAEQFEEGHSATGGRAIDLASHLVRRGDSKGHHVAQRLMHFGRMANDLYLWIVDEEGNFYLANRHTMLHDMPQMNPEKIDRVHRRHKLPHATLARGRRIVGSGEVFVEAGLVKWFNTASGHYFDRENIAAFNRQGKEVFEFVVKEYGWGYAAGKPVFQVKHKS